MLRASTGLTSVRDAHASELDEASTAGAHHMDAHCPICGDMPALFLMDTLPHLMTAIVVIFWSSIQK